MRILLLILFVSTSSLLSAQSDSLSWPGVEFSHARAYSINSKYPGSLKNLLHEGVFFFPRIDSTSAILTDDQVQLALRFANGQIGTPEEGAACYMPRHAIIFFDSADKPVAGINICFECNRIVLSPFIEMDMGGSRQIWELMKELRIPVGKDEPDSWWIEED